MPSAWYEISHIFQIKGQNSEVVSQGLNRGDFYKNIFHEIDPISIFFKSWAVLISRTWRFFPTIKLVSFALQEQVLLLTLVSS